MTPGPLPNGSLCSLKEFLPLHPKASPKQNTARPRVPNLPAIPLYCPDSLRDVTTAKIMECVCVYYCRTYYKLWRVSLRSMLEETALRAQFLSWIQISGRIPYQLPQMALVLYGSPLLLELLYQATPLVLGTPAMDSSIAGEEGEGAGGELALVWASECVTHGLDWTLFESVCGWAGTSLSSW